MAVPGIWWPTIKTHEDWLEVEPALGPGGRTLASLDEYPCTPGRHGAWGAALTGWVYEGRIPYRLWSSLELAWPLISSPFLTPYLSFWGA